MIKIKKDKKKDPLLPTGSPQSIKFYPTNKIVTVTTPTNNNPIVVSNINKEINSEFFIWMSS